MQTTGFYLEVGLCLRSFTGYISFVVEDDPPRPPKPEPHLKMVRCPQCEFDKAVIMFVQQKESTCFCPRCGTVFDLDTDAQE